MKKSVFYTNTIANISPLKLGASVLLIASLTACGGGGGGGEPAANIGSTVSGSAQKGAFQTGATITAQELDATANPTSNTVNAQITDNLGAYSLSTPWSGWTEISVNGQYLDEFTGTVITTPITLNSIQQLSAGNVSVNVNLFSHFVAARLKYRVNNDNEAIETAKTGAEAELQSALSLSAVNTEQLDLHNGDGANANANAVLLLFSGSFMAEGGNNALLATLTDDFKVDGQFDASNLQGIATRAATANIINTLASNLSNNGVSNPPDASDLVSVPNWQNAAPVASDVNETTTEDSSNVSITLSASDAENDSLSYSKVSDPANGTVSITGNTATYTPKANHNGSDSFTYKANDGISDSNTATVTITITAVNDAPTVSDINTSTTEDTAKAITLQGADVDNDSLTYSIVTPPQQGSLGAITGNTVTYTPNPNQNGSDSFTYKVNDGTVDSSNATVSINVGAVNDAPVANNGSDSTDEDTAKTITLTASDTEGDSLTYSIVTPPQNGSLDTITGNTVTYTPNANYNGSDSFTFKANDGSNDSNTAIISLTINAINDAPTANAGTDVQVLEGKTVTLDGSNSNDIEDTVTYSWSPATHLDDATAAQPVFTAPAVSADTEQTLTLTVTDSESLTASDTVKVTILNLPGQPQNVQAAKGDTQATISWDSVSDATGYDICMATESISDPANCSVQQNGAIQANQTSPAVISSLTNDTIYYFVVIPKNANGEGEVSEQVEATPSGVVQPTPTGKLNDTGITQCADYAYDGGSDNHNNALDCNGVDPDGDPIPQGQDATHGRDADVATNDGSDGHKGFSFTKLDANGAELADQSSTNFSCVKDNVTGLIWEVKTNDGGLHDKNDRYTWYNTDTTSNGGAVGFERQSDSSLSSPNDNSCDGYTDGVEGTYCNTEAYVARVNASNNGAGLCGATNWRMPTVNELQSIADMSRRSPAIDTGYFPNAASSWYWSGTAYDASYAWDVYFGNGGDGWGNRGYDAHVRLVRSGQ